MHRYKVREIAQQAGLSEATVDRVLNNRPASGRTPAPRYSRPSQTWTSSGRSCGSTAAAICSMW